MLIVCLLLIIATIVVGIFFVVANLREDIITSFGMSGRMDIDFDVFYLPNNIWDENPVPPHLHFLMSLTDFIEARSDLTATFSEEVTVEYTYTAVKTLEITYMGAVGGGTNPLLFQEIHVLSEQEGQQTATRLNFRADNPLSPGGAYQIDPRPFIDTYFEVMAYQRYRMARENIIARGFRGMSAELNIDFTYTLRIREYGINQRITRGYRLLLTGEVYSFISTGDSASFSDSVNISVIPGGIEVGAYAYAALALVFVTGLAGLIHSIIKLTADPNEFRREATRILKKYNGEIVVVDKPVDTSLYKEMIVQDFMELLKLAVNLSKHIMCYHNEDIAQYVIIIDGYIYVYFISYHPPPTIKVPEEGVFG